MSSRARRRRATPARCAWEIPHTWLYGRCNAANCPSGKTENVSSTGRVLVPTEASTTVTPSRRNSGTRVAIMFSMPP
ncbi:hypothetical protein QTQ03_04375 [Micromonospora sp. WMMA1363]|uniref:hypothetical protein n=1 Tax=Micromonospora sp. WMMA1363 TaxID=3053985 RepID=UPI00259CCABD|nr:hypothetical protein [Micromonospora sp. WMMA1363]MDM4718868.1 hypothetical protein [Micromonospora sp. WMMA1363]